MTDYDKYAEVVGQAAKQSGKTFFSAFMGEASLPKAREILHNYGIPQYPYPEPAIKTFEAMVKYRNWLDSAPSAPRLVPADRERVAAMFQEARRVTSLASARLAR
jgi:acyl-CoA synthetase (NDP forming)